MSSIERSKRRKRFFQETKKMANEDGKFQFQDDIGRSESARVGTRRSG